MAPEPNGDELNTTTKRVNKVLQSIDCDKDMLTALKELSNYFPENTIQSRRNLRSQIEKRSLSINDNFLDAFRCVKESLDAIYLDVTQMNEAVQDMSHQLNATETQTRQLIEQTSKLQAESEKLSMEEQVATSYLNIFQLSEKELKILREGQVSSEFFDVLDRVAKIHQDCRSLVSSGGQTLALEIMEQMAACQEVALERLYRWAQAHCKDIDSQSSVDLLATAMSRLQERPVLLKYVISAYCTHRRSLMVREFLEALTKGVHDDLGGIKPPLEMSAFDPLQYVADTLAFLQQALASHNLHALLSKCDTIDVKEHMRDAISQISEGVVTPLKNRIDHLIASEDLALTSLCEIMSKLQEHRESLAEVMAPDGGLTKGLMEMERACGDRLFPRLNAMVKKEISENVALPPSGLTPSPGIEPLLSLLRALLSVPPPHDYVDPIVNGILEPLVQGVSLSASRLVTVDMSVYLLNCLHLIVNTVMLYEFMDSWLERLQAQCDAQLDTLTSEQASSLVANLNLTQIYSLLQDNKQRENIQPSLLSNFTSKLERYIAAPDLLTLPQVECLMSIAHRTQVLRRAALVIVATYKQLYSFVHDPTNGYATPSSLLPRSPEEVESHLTRGGHPSE